MARDKNTGDVRTDQLSEQQQQQRGLQRFPSRSLATWDPADLFAYGPFSLFRRMQDDMNRLFGGSSGRGWTPAIETLQRGNEFVIRAEVPGLSRDDLTVEIGDDSVTIQGERKYDHEEEREGVFLSERAYGTFTRVIPLPEDALPESAKANFKDGVLEIAVQAPSKEVRRGRRIDINQGQETKTEQRR